MNAKNEIITEADIHLSGLQNINEKLSTHYLIYKIINNENGKYYVGQHKTNNIYDRYMGSSEILHNAINKYTISAFTKTILFDFDNFDDMNTKEAELVQLSNCYPLDPLSYNIKEGGINGQLSDISKKKISDNWKVRLSSMTEDDKKNMTKGIRIWWNKLSDDELQIWKNSVSKGGKKRFENIDARKKMSDRFKGKNNPMYGKSIFDNMTKEDRQKYHNNMSKASSGRCHMYHPITHKNINPKKEFIQQYLEQGYVFGQFNKNKKL